MLYVVVDKEGTEKVLLVKADNENDVRSKLQLNASQEIVGTFTSHETDALASARFVVISG